MQRHSVSSPHALASLAGRSTVGAILLLCAGLALSGCGKQHATSMLAPAGGAHAVQPVESSTQVALDGAVHLQGVIGPGALWSIDVPANWNNDLVVWLHGYTNPAAPIALPAFGPMRDAMLAQGYAVVASSYTENGFAAKEGLIQSHQLRGVFASNIGQPRRTYLVGVSLGGLIGALLTEKHPDQYDGSLLISGIVGGTPNELKYVGDVRVLFDVVYPGVLPGDLLHIPAGTNVNQVLGAAQAAVLANPQGVGIIAALARVHPEYASGAELVQTILTAIGFQLQGANDILARTHGHSFFDNADHIYAGPLPPALLAQINAGVARYTSTPDADNYVAHYGTPDGDLQIPVITLHNSRDPVVPYQNEGWYLPLVTAHGATGFLVQRTLSTPYGHSAILPSELTANLADLAHWVDTGIKPAP